MTRILTLWQGFNVPLMTDVQLFSRTTAQYLPITNTTENKRKLKRIFNKRMQTIVHILLYIQFILYFVGGGTTVTGTFVVSGDFRFIAILTDSTLFASGPSMGIFPIVSDSCKLI